jgi:uncharacterized protein (DUF934 family)
MFYNQPNGEPPNAPPSGSLSMSQIITDLGLGPDSWTAGFTPIEVYDAEPDHVPVALSLRWDTDPETLSGRLDGVRMIRIDVPSFEDGQALSLARALRAMGYQGRLRARGANLADQYRIARHAGFDEIELPPRMDRAASATPSGQQRPRYGLGRMAALPRTA